MSRLPRRIRLPESLQDFFEQSGTSTAVPEDKRSGPRTRVRTHGVLFPERSLPAFPRMPQPLAIHTCDFSKTGFGFLSPEQFYPGEEVRVVLATFWMCVRVRRCRRLGPDCYEIGTTLLSRHDPSADAFEDEMMLA